MVVAGLRGAFARYKEDDVWAALAVTMDLFGRAARQLAAKLALPYSDSAEAHARDLVGRYRAGRGGSG